jgi:hypothetical protein
MQATNTKPISTLLSAPKMWRPTSKPINNVTLGAVNLTGVSKNEMPNTIPAQTKHKAASPTIEFSPTHGLKR